MFIRIRVICSFLLINLITNLFSNQLPSEVEYLFPIPESMYVSPYTTLILRFKNDALNINPYTASFKLKGESGRDYEGEIILSSDGETIIFKPKQDFLAGDKINVELMSQHMPTPFSYSFRIAGSFVRPSKVAKEADATLTHIAKRQDQAVKVINGVSVPSDFPEFAPSLIGDCGEGLIFLTTWHWFLIFKNDGTPYFYKKCRSHVWDITIQPSGILSYMEGATAKLLNNAFEVTDWYKCKHGYRTDSHDFVHLENGHVLLIAEDTQALSVKHRFPVAPERTYVIATHAQELDRDKNVIFEWRAWDYYEMKDAIHENWALTKVHFNHMNALDVDYDGNLLVSNRHLDEITKINRKTGEIIWRFGGQNNQLTFVNDTIQNNYQHNIRAVRGKPTHYTFFDNGNHRNPPYSRAVEYKVDTKQKTAEKVWEFSLDPPGYSHWMGGVERMPNGNTIVDYVVPALPKVTEVTPDGEIVYQGNFKGGTQTTYRSHRKVFQGQALRPSLYGELSQSHMTLIFNQFGEKSFKYYKIYADTVENPVTLVDTTSNTHIHLEEFVNRKQYHFRVTSVDSNDVESDYSNEIEAFINFAEPGDNLIQNGDFLEGIRYWSVNPEGNEYSDWDFWNAGRCQVSIHEISSDPQDISFFQDNIVLNLNVLYRLEFEASADRDRLIEARLMNSTNSYDYSQWGYIYIGRQTKTYSHDFIMGQATDYAAQLVFSLGHDVGEVHIDNISLKEQISNSEDSEKTNRINTFELYQNFPNPFNASTTITYMVGFECNIELEIFDLRGRRVLQKTFEKSPGKHQFVWEANKLSSGIYTARITASSEPLQQRHTQMQKMVLLK